LSTLAEYSSAFRYGKYNEQQDDDREISELKRVTAVQQPRDSL